VSSETILGVTKDVDMIFTRQYNRPRLQVLVLDPMLIPMSIDVVIGDNIYELHFRVELEEMHELLKPLDVEDDSDEFDKKKKRRGQVAVNRGTSCKRIDHWTVIRAGSSVPILQGRRMVTKVKRRCNSLLQM
jgi:hypothetical protein